MERFAQLNPRMIQIQRSFLLSDVHGVTLSHRLLVHSRRDDRYAGLFCFPGSSGQGAYSCRSPGYRARRTGVRRCSGYPLLLLSCFSCTIYCQCVVDRGALSAISWLATLGGECPRRPQFSGLFVVWCDAWEGMVIPTTNWVLDIGCGFGNTACLIAEQYGARVQGIDLSEVMIAKANCTTGIPGARRRAPGYLRILHVPDPTRLVAHCGLRTQYFLSSRPF